MLYSSWSEPPTTTKETRVEEQPSPIERHDEKLGGKLQARGALRRTTAPAAPLREMPSNHVGDCNAQAVPGFAR